MAAISGMSGVTAFAAVAGGAALPSTLRGVDTSQMVSYLQYANVTYQGNVNSYFDVL